MSQAKVFHDLYHVSADKPGTNERSRSRNVTIDSEGTTRTVTNTPEGIKDEYGNTISARIDTQGRLMDVLEPRMYYGL